jgi:hypothetical protein
MASGDGYSVSIILVFGTPTDLYIDLNIPICGFTLVLVVLFLNLRTPSGSFATKLKKIDIVYETQRSKFSRCLLSHSGNILVVASTTSVMIGLTWGGVQYAWSSARILTSLILGCVGLGLFLWYEFTVATNPIVSKTTKAIMMVTQIAEIGTAWASRYSYGAQWIYPNIHVIHRSHLPTV